MKPGDAGGDLEPLPGQLLLPGMPDSGLDATIGQAALPGLEDLSDPAPADDPELAGVAASLTELDPDGSRMAAAIRGALDMLLDGQHTGRYRWDQLHKTRIWFTIVNLQAGNGPSGMGHTMARSAHQRRADTLREGADAGWACPAPGSLTALRAAWSRRGEPKPSYNCTLKLHGFSGWPLGDRRPTAC